VDDIPGYLRAGAVAVGMGGPLVGRALEDDEDLRGLGDRARAALEAVVRGRSRE
jgi:2-dehydro-3-deoxyphosphogluconate aldolase/(4S)-4-hydroxy-2-oxoglutarate aldolase